jgi:hypothetical protein
VATFFHHFFLDSFTCFPLLLQYLHLCCNLHFLLQFFFLQCLKSFFTTLTLFACFIIFWLQQPTVEMFYFQHFIICFFYFFIIASNIDNVFVLIDIFAHHIHSAMLQGFFLSNCLHFLQHPCMSCLNVFLWFGFIFLSPYFQV